ncbi:MAG: hypothetical protein ABI461_18910, partial [Polyangiaceae bacterium]
KYLAVTADDIKKAVAKYLTKDKRSRVEVRPGADSAAPATPAVKAAKTPPTATPTSKGTPAPKTPAPFPPKSPASGAVKK